MLNIIDDFWSRTDQLIMGNFGVINALQNPFTENNYHIEGQKHILKIQIQILNILFKNEDMI